MDERLVRWILIFNLSDNTVDGILDRTHHRLLLRSPLLQKIRQNVKINVSDWTGFGSFTSRRNTAPALKRLFASWAVEPKKVWMAGAGVWNLGSGSTDIVCWANESYK